METELACASEKEAQEMNKQRCEVQTPECVAGGGLKVLGWLSFSLHVSLLTVCQSLSPLTASSPARHAKSEEAGSGLFKGSSSPSRPESDCGWD